MILRKPFSSNSGGRFDRFICRNESISLGYAQFGAYWRGAPRVFHSLAISRLKTSGIQAKKKRNNDVDGLRSGDEFRASEEEVAYGEREREVLCEVEVISWRERMIKAEIRVEADTKSVWNALTDYERLADYIPNLISSRRIPCPHPGRIWLEQRGFQRALYWHIEARVVLDLQEFRNALDGHELHFSMVDGDFKKFEGKWTIKPGRRSVSSILSYEVNVIPRLNFPAIFLERIIRSDLPVNLKALALRAESNDGNSKFLTARKLNAEPVPFLSNGIDNERGLLEKPGGVLSLLPSQNVNDDGPLVEKDTSLHERESIFSSMERLPHSSNGMNSNWGMFQKVCRLSKHCMADEVHLRRYDGLLEDGGVHRCVVASITIKAPVRGVWNVLTAYESLPEVVPNLAICKVLSRDNNKVRILQEGCKGLLYMVLHARAILDLHEYLEQEINFEQVEGDFDSFRGKWILEQMGGHHTLLKYSVESKMRSGIFLSEAIMEEIIYEDLPSNLCAIRDYIEKREATCSVEMYKHEELRSSEDSLSEDDHEAGISKINEQVSDISVKSSSKHRPRVPGLQSDFEVLETELLKFVSEHGQEGFMPMRKQLRMRGRVDIEKAITRMGGFRRIASRMNLSLAYKYRRPRGYWDNLENLEQEINRFQKSWGMDPSFMPSRKCFERAGRYDIARALEKWGGLHEVSRLLSLKVRHPNRLQKTARDRGTEAALPAEAEDNNLTKPYVSQDTDKWLTKLKELDINWVQ